VLDDIPPEVQHVVVVDDKCPDQSGHYVLENSSDPRVTVVFNEVNLGVGGAVLRGYQEGIRRGATVLVKIDGDGQMDPALLSQFTGPLLSGQADYAKGNRFYDLGSLSSMPKLRVFGNAVLSFMAKVSSGYWEIFDPTNGYTAITAAAAEALPFDKLSKRYFFETDMLFRLSTVGAHVVDIPMNSKYGEEVSGLSAFGVVPEFTKRHAVNFVKRIFYSYYLRGMSAASLELPLGVGLLGFGIIFGSVKWIGSIGGAPASSGTVMLAALPVIVGTQFVLSFLSYDMTRRPRNPKFLINPQHEAQVIGFDRGGADK